MIKSNLIPNLPTNTGFLTPHYLNILNNFLVEHIKSHHMLNKVLKITLFQSAEIH